MQRKFANLRFEGLDLDFLGIEREIGMSYEVAEWLLRSCWVANRVESGDLDDLEGLRRFCQEFLGLDFDLKFGMGLELSWVFLF